LKIKYRESFRPFAPAVLAEYVSEYFDQEEESPYMLIVSEVKLAHRIAPDPTIQDAFGLDRLNQQRSDIPAVTHVDYTARIQTVHHDTNPRFHALLSEFHRQTGCPVLVNTSFNVRGEPIVCTPEDAYRCFMRTEMDYLVIENCLLAKSDQPAWEETANWQQEFELD
jgi:carbamoyltransferase